MEKEGYRQATVRSAIEALKSVARQAELLDVEGVKTYLAKSAFSDSRKERLSNDLLQFYKYSGLKFDRPQKIRLHKQCR
jgi:hypothetical protein